MVREHADQLSILRAQSIEHGFPQNICDFVGWLMVLADLLALRVRVADVGLGIVDDLTYLQKLCAVDSG